jgi:hypothetical protein
VAVVLAGAEIEATIARDFAASDPLSMIFVERVITEDCADKGRAIEAMRSNAIMRSTEQAAGQFGGITRVPQLECERIRLKNSDFWDEFLECQC